MDVSQFKDEGVQFTNSEVKELNNLTDTYLPGQNNPEKDKRQDTVGDKINCYTGKYSILITITAIPMSRTL